MKSDLALIALVRESLIRGRAGEAADHVETLAKRLQDSPPEGSERALVEQRLADLRTLAEAALAGTHEALRQIDEIIAAARSLRTYDNEGRRQVTSIAAEQPRRF